MARQNIVVDASVFLARLMPSDGHFDSALRFFDMLRKKKIIVTIPVTTLFEILHAYFRTTKNRNATDAIYQEMIEWNLSKSLHLVNIESSFLIHFIAHHHLFDTKTADAIVATTAYHLKYPLVTLDKGLLKNAKKHTEAMTPEEFLAGMK